MDVPARNRPLVLLVAVVLVQILLLAFQIKREHDVRLIRVWSVALLMPVERVGTFTITKIESGWYDYVDLWHARQDNRELRTEISHLRIENEQLQGRAAEAARLGQLLGFREANANVPMIAADVISANADSNSHTIFINRGEREGLRRNMAVITPDGIVGKVAEVYPHTAQILLISDKESGVGALLAESRTHGIIKGTGDPQLSMDYVVNEEKVPLGEKVLTSGEDRIFPKDLPVGTVVSIKAGSPFLSIAVRPAARLDRLEEVFVLLKEEMLNPRSLGEESSSAPPAKLPERSEKREAAKPEAEKTKGKEKGGTETAKPGAAKEGAAKTGAAKPESAKTNAAPAAGAATSSANSAAAGAPAGNSKAAQTNATKSAAQNSTAGKSASSKAGGTNAAPAAAKPGASVKKPTSTTKPGTTRPGTTKPGGTKPDATKPGGTNPGGAGAGPGNAG